jgi:hypothetical protein
MGRRFGRYKFALKSLRNPTSPDTPVTPPSGSALEQFQKFLKEEIVLDYTRSEASKQISIQIVGVNPFALEDAAANVAKVRVSERAATKGTGSMVTACNQSASDLAVLELRGFVPARAVVSDENSSASTTATASQITGVKYVPSKFVSYSFPYGKSSTKKLESEVRTSILVVAKDFIDPPKVTFKSEKF